MHQAIEIASTVGGWLITAGIRVGIFLILGSLGAWLETLSPEGRERQRRIAEASKAHRDTKAKTQLEERYEP